MTLCLKITPKSLIFRNSAVSLHSSAFFALGQKVLPDFGLEIAKKIVKFTKYIFPKMRLFR